MIPPIRPFKPSYDRTPKYSVKEVSEMTGLSSYTIRYYDNAGLIPGLDRTEGNARLFSDYAVSWLHLVHCLRTTGLPVEQVRHYIRLCQKGDSTIRERGEMIFRQNIGNYHISNTGTCKHKHICNTTNIRRSS